LLRLFIATAVPVVYRMLTLIVLIALLSSSAHVSAQFNTITNRTATIKITNGRVQKQNNHPESVEMVNVMDSATMVGNNMLVDKYLSVAYPLASIVVTSPFGVRRDPISGKTSHHGGVDLRAHFQPVYAMMHGTVVRVGFERKGGNFLTIQHGDYSVTYCHLSQVLVRNDASVKPGDVVAVSGASGTRCTGPHLHIGVKYKGKAINPMVILDFIRQTRESVLRELISHCDVYVPDSLSR
jgi:murein DD-endopeptidase